MHANAWRPRRTLKMPVVEGKTDAVQAKALEKYRIGFGKEVFQELGTIRLDILT